MTSPNNEKQINTDTHSQLIQENPGGEILGLGSFPILRTFSHSKERTKRNDAVYFDHSEKLKFTPLIPRANSWQTADNIDINQIPRSTQYNTVNIGNNDMTWQDAFLIGCVKKKKNKTTKNNLALKYMEKVPRSLPFSFCLSYSSTYITWLDICDFFFFYKLWFLFETFFFNFHIPKKSFYYLCGQIPPNVIWWHINSNMTFYVVCCLCRVTRNPIL